jgi:transcriptional regulator with XRE-family HTH domain
MSTCPQSRSKASSVNASRIWNDGRHIGGGHVAANWRVHGVVTQRADRKYECMNKTRIAILRQEHGWTQERLATESGIGLRTVQRIESGSDASLETLSLLADALRVPVRDLFSSMDDSDLGNRVASLEVRTEQQQYDRDRIVSAWRWLYIGIGIAVTLVSFTLGGAALAVLVAYWVAGYIILTALRRLFLEPMLERKFPLSRSKRELRAKRVPDSSASVQ